MKKNILLVDDDATILEAFAMLLEYNGYKVSTAKDGLSACKLAKKTKFDVIVLDFILPDMKGIEVFEDIRKSGLSKRAKAILLTGYPLTEISASIKKSNISKCFEKPIRNKDLILAIENLTK